MRRRLFLASAAAAAAFPTLTRAQEAEQEAAGQEEAPAGAPGVTIDAPAPMIEPANALEFAFVSALTNENMRPVFRRYLMDTHVALAMSGEGANATALEVEVEDGFVAAAIFTSAARVDDVLGEDAPRIMINGRAAFERLEGKNVVINYRLRPMLTLEPEDVARYLEAPGESSAGPSQ